MEIINRPKLVVCVKNGGDDDLQVGKIYRVMADESAEKSDYIRVIDDSQEDYLYPWAYFMPLETNPTLEQTLLAIL